MEGMLGIIQSLIGANRSQLPKVIKSLEEHQVFSQKPINELHPTVQHIYDLLSNFHTRHEGLMLLYALLPQCPLDVLDQKGVLWINLCTKICSQRKPLESVDLAYNVLTELIKKSANVPDLSKSLSSNLLGKMIETITIAPPTAFFAALKFLEIAMITYPGPCGPSKNIIKNFVLTFIDSIDGTLVKQSAKCLHLLQQIRGGGVHGISHKQSWAQLQTQIVGSLHEYLNMIFANTTEIVDGSLESEERLNLPAGELSDEPVTRSTQLETRFVNLCKYLATVLIEPFPVAKTIKPSKILNLISRGLAVNCQTLSKNLITDNIVIGSLLPRIHVALLNLLDSLILVLRSHMLLYGKSVCQLANQSLKWTASGKSKGFKRLFASIRMATYRTLETWCKTASYGSGVEIIADDLVEQILQDITPFQNEVTLKVLAGSKKHLSKRAKQKLLKAQNDTTNLAQTHSTAANLQNSKNILSDEGNEQLCRAALRCLINILSSTGCFLKPATHILLQEKMVSISISVVQSSNLKSTLYASAACRQELFGALHALIVSSHYLCPPPVQYAATVFALAKVNDSSSKVRDSCANYMCSIEKILHPQKESLYFPPDPSDLRNALKSIDEVDVENDDESENEEIVINEESDIVKPSGTNNEIANNNSNAEKESQEEVNPLCIDDEKQNEELLSAPISIENSKSSSFTESSNDFQTQPQQEIIEDAIEAEEMVDVSSSLKSSSRKREASIRLSPIPAADVDEINKDIPSSAKKCKQVSDSVNNNNNSTLLDKSELDIVEELASSFVEELNDE